jgi:hypothetical protein
MLKGFMNRFRRPSNNEINIDPQSQSNSDSSAGGFSSGNNAQQYHNHINTNSTNFTNTTNYVHDYAGNGSNATVDTVIANKTQHMSVAALPSNLNTNNGSNYTNYIQHDMNNLSSNATALNNDRSTSESSTTLQDSNNNSLSNLQDGFYQNSNISHTSLYNNNNNNAIFPVNNETITTRTEDIYTSSSSLTNISMPPVQYVSNSPTTHTLPSSMLVGQSVVIENTSTKISPQASHPSGLNNSNYYDNNNSSSSSSSSNSSYKTPHYRNRRPSALSINSSTMSLSITSQQQQQNEVNTNTNVNVNVPSTGESRREAKIRYIKEYIEKSSRLYDEILAETSKVGFISVLTYLYLFNIILIIV